MKKFLLLIAVVAAVISCSEKKSVRELVLENKVDMGDVQQILEHYTRCYFTVPQSKEDIVDFLHLYKNAYTEEFSSYFDANVDGGDYISLIENETVMVEAYKDSAFFYFPNRHFGSCVYSLYYWLLHPEKYMNFDYDMMYSPSVYKLGGEYYFGYKYESLMSYINSLGESFKSVILTQGYDNRFNWGDGGTPILVPMRIIATYDVAKDSLYRTSEFPAQNDSISFSNVVIKTDPDIPSDIYVTYDEDNIKREVASYINLDSLSENLLKSIAPKLKTIAQKDTMIGKIVFPVYLYLNNEQH